MRQPVALITGAVGEIGHALIQRLSERGAVAIVTLDVRPVDKQIAHRVTRAFTGSVTDHDVLDRILAEFEVDRIYHLAALLSTRSEFTPMTAHQVNVEGTLNLLEFAHSQGQAHGRRVTFFYPSSLAAYGIDPSKKDSLPPLPEHAWNLPITMYGCNKLYCEHLGRYYALHHRQLDADRPPLKIDFRSIRFPGLISAVTTPSGGTSDFLPEMIHAAARGTRYACFVRPDTRIPFMAMPDAVEAILDIVEAKPSSLSQLVYNIAAFNPSAEEFRELVGSAFPGAEIEYEPDERRQAIVDSWPAAVDDSKARSDFGHAPELDLKRAFENYLVPTIRERYR
ncbi:MAG: NAD-dependent epimerase/dehydratase family protein [Acidobacteriota bacterium]|nr:NAD-dependent epimerase/dehydratase family protein [Acidobacteriota bacterium]